MKGRHKQLARELRKAGLPTGRRPDEQQWEVLLDRLDRAFVDAEQHRYTLSRALEVSSREARELHQEVVTDRQRLEAIQACLPQAVLELSPTLTVRSANPVAMALFHPRPGAGFGSVVQLVDDCGRWVPTDELTGSTWQVALSCADGAVVIDGAPVPAAWELAPVRLERDLVGVVCVITDLRELKAREGALRQARIDAEVEVVARRTRAHFLANMSHELRTPLNAVLGYTEMVQDEIEDSFPEARQDLDRVIDSATHLLGLIGDLMEIASAEGGRLALHPEAFGVDELMTQVIQAVAPHVERSENRLLVDAQGAELLQDRARLAQVVVNLIATATRLAPRCTIHLRTAVRDGWFEVDVQDEGGGIEPRVLATLFEGFEEGDARDANTRANTGVALSMTRRLARLMGGKVSASSVEGEGSVLSVAVPAVLELPKEVA